MKDVKRRLVEELRGIGKAAVVLSCAAVVLILIITVIVLATNGIG